MATLDGADSIGGPEGLADYDENKALARYRLGLMDYRIVAAVAANLGYGPDEYIHFQRGNPLARKCEHGWEAEVHLELFGQYVHGRASVTGPGDDSRHSAVHAAATSAFGQLRSLVAST